MDSSDESFTWTTASNDSNDSTTMAVEPATTCYEGESESGADYKQKVREAIREHRAADTDADDRRREKRAKKRKGSDAVQDCDDFVHPDKKRIKIEPASDEEARKKKKKSKKRDINVAVDDTQESFDAESYLNMRVKQEQAAFIEPEPVKSKKKKNRKNSVEASDVDTGSETKANVEINGTTEHIDAEDVIEDKFSAEETVIEKRKKKKHKKKHDKEEYGSDDIANYAGSRLEKFEPLSQEYNTEDDTTLQPNDFSCTNIVSSTIINSSVMEDIKQTHKPAHTVTHTSNDNETSQATRNIVDRIRFEDDENSSHLDLSSDEQSTKFTVFLKFNPHLKKITPKIQNDSLITEDDEVWILKCPHEVDVKKLKNTNLSIEGKCKIKIGGQTYDGTLDEDPGRVPLLSYQRGQTYIKNLQVSGRVDYRKRIPKAHIPDNNNMVNNQTNFILLPETKCRHPLFGANYKKAIKIPSSVAERLEAAKSGCLDNSHSPKKKKSKKDKKRALDVKIEDQCKEEPKLEPPDIPKKKKKRKHSPEPEGVAKKIKRIKHEPNSAEAWESEQAIEENLFNF